MAAERRRTESSSNLVDLPPDILLLILARSDPNQYRLLSLSLVCKFFRFLTYKLVRKLTFDVNPLPTASDLRKLLAMCSSVTQISIRSTSIANALTLIDRSGIKTECLGIYQNPKSPQIDICYSGRLGEFKSLKLGLNVRLFDPVDLVGMFPSLEELNLSGCGYYDLRDEWILKLALNSRRLRKVNLDYSNSVTARALDALAVYCVDLERVSFVGCRKISFQGVLNFVQKAKKLKSLELPRYLFSELQVLPVLTPANTKRVCQSLSHLSINGGLLKDVFLLAIAGLQTPLTSLELKVLQIQHPSYSMAGLSPMLRAVPRLTRLDLHLPWPGSDGQDKQLSQLVKSLPRLKNVSLVSWSPICSTLFSLINNCSLLECISIKCQNRYTQWDMPQGIRRNYSIQRIHIHPWPDTLFRMALISLCPSLKISVIQL